MADQLLDVQLPDGSKGTIPASQKASLPEGTKFLTKEQAAAEKRAVALDQKYDPFKEGNLGRAAAGFAGAAGLGVARGASAHLSDAIAAAVGQGDTVKELQEAFPGVSAVGEVGGMVGAAALTGGAASGLGVGAAAGEAGLLARTGMAAARGAAEMGIYEAGRSIGDQALEGKGVDGEKVVSALGHGALLGGLTGGGLELLGGLGSRALRGVGRGAPGEAAAAETQLAKPGSLRETLGQKAQELSDERFANALGGTKGQLKTINKNVEGGWSRVATDTKAALKEDLGVASLPADRKELADAVEAAIEKRTAARAQMLEKLDEAKTAIAPSPEAVAARLRQEIIEPNLVTKTVLTDTGPVTLTVPRFGKEAVVKEAEDLVARFQHGFGDGPPTFKKWAESITDLGKEGKWDARITPAGAQVKQQAYGIMSKELATMGDEAAASLGGSFSAGYKANQGVLQSLLKARELVETGVAGNAVNNGVGLTARLAGMAGASVGATIGGPLGAIAGGVVSGGLGKLVQDRGSMLAVDLLDRGAAILGVRRLAARTERDIAHGVGELIGVRPAVTAAELAPPRRGPAAPMGVRADDSPKSFKKVVAAVMEAQANPSAVTARVGRSLGPLAETSPGAAAAASAVAIGGLAFLASKLPQMRRDPYGLQPHLEEPRVSDADRARFMRYAAAVDKPTMVLAEAKKGTLTREHVEAVKAVYPNLYEEMRVQVMHSLIESKSPLPYARRVQLGILLDIPTDKTLSPEFIAAIQATYTPAEKAGEEAPPAMPRATEAAPTMQTAMQSAASGGMK